MPNECKHEAKLRNSRSELDEHSAINRDENEPKAI